MRFLAHVGLSLAKARAFVARDFIIDSSYKADFAVEVLRSLFPLFSFYYIGKLIQGEGMEGLSRYGQGYFPFVMVGLALGHYLTQALHSFAASIRRAQMAGCLEAMLSTRTSPQVVIVLSPLYSFVFDSIHVLLIFFVGATFLGVDLGQCNYSGVLLILVLSIAAFSSIGILAAATIIILKKGDPIEWILGASLSLVSGVYFPIEVLPSWLEKIAWLSPLTHAVEAMRLAVFQGYTANMLIPQLTALVAMFVVFFPTGVWFFGWAVEQGRRDGSLMQY